jgi:hypothetical protein
MDITSPWLHAPYLTSLSKDLRGGHPRKAHSSHALSSFGLIDVLLLLTGDDIEELGRVRILIVLAIFGDRHRRAAVDSHPFGDVAYQARAAINRSANLGEQGSHPFNACCLVVRLEADPVLICRPAIIGPGRWGLVVGLEAVGRQCGAQWCKRTKRCQDVLERAVSLFALLLDRCDTFSEGGCARPFFCHRSSP